jgi:sialidase-1
MKRFVYCAVVLLSPALGGEAIAAPLFEQVDVWTAGADGYHTYRIPSLLVTERDTVLAFCEGRKTASGDHGDLDLLLKRSTDGGRTWSKQQIVYEEGDTAPITIGNPCPVVDAVSTTIWLAFCKDNRQVFITSSTDDGRTWAKPRDISETATRPDWTWVATGPGVGIQLHQSRYAGRLVIPCDHKVRVDGREENNSHMLFSDDRGETWQIGAPIQVGGNECQVIERADGSLLVNTRMQSDFRGLRGTAVSTNGGAGWTTIEHDPQLPCPKCQGSLKEVLDAEGNWITLFSNPDPPPSRTEKPSSERVRLTVRLSRDEGKTWPVARRVTDGLSAYSCLAQTRDRTILCLYEWGEKRKSEGLRLARFNLDWLTAEPGQRPAAEETSAAPVAPSNVRHTASSPAHWRVEWNDVNADETGYRIWRRPIGGVWHLAGETGSAATHFDDGGLQQLTEYEHRVAALYGSTEGPATETPSAAKTASMQQHLEPEVIVPAGRTFPASPAAVPLKSGELLLAYQTGNAEQRRNHTDESIWLMSSSDGRRKWSSPRTLLRGDSNTVYGKSALIRLSNGNLGLTFSRWMLDAKGKIVDRRRQFMASTDEGTSWSDPVDVGHFSANNHTLISAAAGRIVESLSDTTGVGLVFGSDDFGRTWQQLGRVKGKRLGESSLAHLGDGKLVFLARHEWPFYRLSFSNDNGLHWSDEPALLYLGGGDNPPKLFLLPDGKTLAAVVHSWFPGRKSKDRRQLASVVSRDGGRTWDNFRLIGFAPEGDDGFLQHALTSVGDTIYLFYGGGSSRDTNDGEDLRMLRLAPEFFTSTTAWPYDWQGRALDEAPRNP